ncbi:MAG: hypothetical protein RLO08_18690 [Parvibaculaceae bacterium]
MTGAEDQTILGLSVDVWFYLALAYGLGLLVSDLSNRNSWVHHNFRVAVGLGEWAPFAYTESYKMPPSKGADEAVSKVSFLSISLGLYLDRYTKGRVEVFCKTHPFQLNRGAILPAAEGHYEWQEQIAGPLPSGRKVNIDIAHLEKDNAHGYWGNFAVDGNWIKAGFAYVVDVEVRTGHRRQKKRFMLQVPHEKPSWNEEAARLEPGGLFSIYEEDRSPLDVIPKSIS